MSCQANVLLGVFQTRGRTDERQVSRQPAQTRHGCIVSHPLGQLRSLPYQQRRGALSRFYSHLAQTTRLIFKQLLRELGGVNLVPPAMLNKTSFMEEKIVHIYSFDSSQPETLTDHGSQGVKLARVLSRVEEASVVGVDARRS